MERSESLGEGQSDIQLGLGSDELALAAQARAVGQTRCERDENETANCTLDRRRPGLVASGQMRGAWNGGASRSKAGQGES